MLSALIRKHYLVITFLRVYHVARLLNTKRVNFVVFFVDGSKFHTHRLAEIRKIFRLLNMINCSYLE